MPLTLEIKEALKLTTITGTGELTYGELADIFHRYYENPTENVHFLLSEAAFEDLPSAAVEKLAALVLRLREKAREGKTAIVSAQNLTYGLSRMFESLVNLDDKTLLRETRVFRHVGEALDWIERPATRHRVQ